MKTQVWIAAIVAMVALGCGKKAAESKAGEADKAGKTDPASLELTPKQEKGKWGYANPSGEMVIPATYLKTEPFSKTDNVAIVYGAKYPAAIDKTGKVVLEFKNAQSARTFENGRSIVFVKLPTKGMRFGVMDLKGRWVIEPKYTLMGEDLVMGVARWAQRSVKEVDNNDSATWYRGLLNSDFKEITEFVYKDLSVNPDKKSFTAVKEDRTQVRLGPDGKVM